MKWPNILKASHGLTDGLFIHCYVCRVRVVYKNVSVCRATGMYGNMGGLVHLYDLDFHTGGILTWKGPEPPGWGHTLRPPPGTPVAQFAPKQT